MKKKLFDGAVIPLFMADQSIVGSVLGIVTSELTIGPKDLRVNLATPTSEDFGKFRYFWLDGCEKDGPYSTTACYTWLMPRFSSLPGIHFGTSIRVRPTEEKDKTPFDYDIICWARGEPVALGHQYTGAAEASRLLEGKHSLTDMARAWEKGEYKVTASRTIGELNAGMKQIAEKAPAIILSSAKRELEIRARDAGWKYRSPLVAATA